MDDRALNELIDRMEENAGSVKTAFEHLENQTGSDDPDLLEMATKLRDESSQRLASLVQEFVEEIATRRSVKGEAGFLDKQAGSGTVSGKGETVSPKGMADGPVKRRKSREEVSQLAVSLREQATNVVGFSQLLTNLNPKRKFGPVIQLQYRSYVISGSLNLAAIVLQLEPEWGHILPQKREMAFDLLQQARKIQILAEMAELENWEKAHPELFVFATNCIAAVRDL